MLAWLRDLTSRERRTMLACWGGWTLDGFDQQLYSYVVPTVIAVWGMSTGAAGTIGTVTVVTSAFGGWFAGALADRFGRVRMLQIAILWYSVFTFLCGFAQNFEQLFILRGLHGLGFGGEWATGAVLMGEVIRDKVSRPRRRLRADRRSRRTRPGGARLRRPVCNSSRSDRVAGVIRGRHLARSACGVDPPQHSGIGSVRGAARQRRAARDGPPALGVSRAVSVADDKGVLDGHGRSGWR